jgi:serine-type D-Ala-D-Ala endopeptidase (penicillin-binding protein 7)
MVQFLSGCSGFRLFRLAFFRLLILTAVVSSLSLLPMQSMAKQTPKATSKKVSSSAKAVKSIKVVKGKAAKQGKDASKKKSKRGVKQASASPTEPPRVSLGQAIGLHAVSDPAELKSSVALAVDSRTGKTLFEKNSQAVLPIASITKLMTAMVVLDAKQPMGEPLEISSADVDLEKNSRSRLRTGSVLNRGELLQLALMASENRAANALGRYYPRYESQSKIDSNGRYAIL